MESPLRALIVDDADMSRRITRRIISKVFICDDAENGLIAVSKYREAIESGAPYDVVFMDIVMPEMDGKEAVKTIRELETKLGVERTPIIMVSASEMLDEIDELVNGLLRKAVTRQSLNSLLFPLFDGRMEPL